MSLSWLHRLLKKSRPLPRPVRTNAPHGRFLPQVEALAERVLPAVTATFFAADGTLRVVGDALDNTVVVSRTAAGTILVNNGAVAIQGGAATVANTAQIFINGGAGNDNISLDETNGALPAAALFGGAGNDVLTGGSGDDFADGGPGNDMAFLGAGDDTFEWLPGDGSDMVEGQGGRDTLAFNGSNDVERFDLSANGTRARFTRDVGGVTMDLNGVEEIDLDAPGGGDTVTINDQSATGLNTFNVDLGGPAGRVNNQADVVIINGTNGNDVGQIRSLGPTSINATVSAIPFVNITNTVGTNDRLVVNTRGGNDVLDASDLAAGLIKLTVNGGTGNDALTGSQGFDDFLWTPGDGSDTIEGGGGGDRIVVDGSDAADKFTISANGTRARITSDVDGGTVDVGGVETIVVNPLGGADTVTVNDLTGTAVTGVGVNLVATLAGPAGDGQADSVIVNGRNAADLIPIRGGNGLVFIDGGAGVGGGLSFGLSITAAEAAIDTLTVNGLGGNDTVDASGLAAGVINLTVNGGAGNDTLIGSQGDDVFVWNPGDGSDTIDGQAGIDTLRFVGDNGDENIALSANGPRARLTRDVGGVTMDLSGLEVINVLALGGADTITVNDLTGTGVRAVNLPLGPAANTGDGQPDTVIVNGTNGNDHINIVGLAAGAPVVNVIGLSAQVSIIDPDGPGDSLVVNALGGNDTVDASNLDAGLIGLTVTGGAGDDTLIGSQGNDDFLWNPGDGSDTIDGQGGLDALTFNGSDAAENFVIARNGSHVRLTSDVGNVTMDLNAVEGIQVNALGGADTITVNDLTGTALVKVQLDLSGAAGGGDGQADNVVVNGTNGDDVIRVAAAGNTVLVDGLFPAVRITGSDGVTDHLTVNTLGGNDTVDSTGLPAGLIGLTVNLDDGQAAATTTALRTSVPTAVVGQAVTFTATVTAVAPGAGTPTGTVTFLDGSTVLGTAAVGADGTATLTTRFAAAGGHALTAVYGGDGTFAGSAQALTEQVSAPAAPAPTTTTLVASRHSARRRQAATFTATVRGAAGAGTPTGIVTFFVGSTVVARVTLDANGQARLRRSFARTGRVTIRAVYSGDANFTGSSQRLSKQVN